MKFTWDWAPETKALQYPVNSLERMVLEDEAAREARARDEWWISQAWDEWVIASCEERGGHWWWLDFLYRR